MENKLSENKLSGFIPFLAGLGQRNERIGAKAHDPCFAVDGVAIPPELRANGLDKDMQPILVIN